ncbi:hypothetical protein JRO89_XS01G0227400 [Xanthoceras sorbifolium]|uniref:Glycosyltransferase family 92 protein n=1 Tax=Xanthoceras sorbifolium TaxID=99658 RepID=A0ABQ8IKP3_9ROSI|nr:hypothetical protein JRO89_XS01G0227400 [Xanthoceras sorbifolium]
MKDRLRRNDIGSWGRLFWCTILVVCACVFFSGSITFSAFRFFFGEQFHPVLGSTWQPSIMEAIGYESPVSVRETVMLPDQVLVFLKYLSPAQLFSKDDVRCVYSSGDDDTSSQPLLKEPPMRIDVEDFDNPIVRCPIPPRGSTLSLDLKSGKNIPVGPTIHRWDSVAYESLIDRDNTTVVFVKGLNLRPERLSNASRFECVFGWDFRSTKFLLRTPVLSISQEIVRCKTPLSVLSGPPTLDNHIKASVRVKGGQTIRSIARLVRRSDPDPPVRKEHVMCICTMLRNQARFFREWIMYHAQIGVQRWFIYDNNSDDDIEDVIKLLLSYSNYNITRHIWPWIKTQESGFAHCALRARDTCEWVGFIDVDEFFHVPTGLTIHDVIENFSTNSTIGELRASCHSFGPSGLKQVPTQGVMVGYTCRQAAPERHKSIVRPEALNSTLINVVHHFHLKGGFEFLNLDIRTMVINHYKYQVWDVFKEKFYRRVATYVADWQETQNVGSKDRAPGLGTRAVEPPDWSTRFCEVNDTGLRDRVLENYTDPETLFLPWQAINNPGEETMKARRIGRRKEDK